MDPTTSSPGFGHFIAQSDALGQSLLVLLLAMPVVSWVLVAFKGLAHWRRQRRSNDFLAGFWNAPTLDAVQHTLSVQGPPDPFAHLTAHALHAQQHHTRRGATRLADAGSTADFITCTFRKVLDEETTGLESDLTPLATVGATAPFVGLFGTVWGVYHALVAIGMSGAGKVHPPATALSVPTPQPQPLPPP